MAEALLRTQLGKAGVRARVGSAGLLPGGARAAADAIAVMAARDIDISEHVSCQLTPDIVRSANLVIGMARGHVRETCVNYGGLLQRSFTLKEIVRRGEMCGPRREDETLYTWLGRIGVGRQPAELVGDTELDDVADPVGGPRSFYEKMADEIRDLTERFVWSVVGVEIRAGAGYRRV